MKLANSLVSINHLTFSLVLIIYNSKEETGHLINHILQRFFNYKIGSLTAMSISHMRNIRHQKMKEHKKFYKLSKRKLIKLTRKFKIRKMILKK